MPHLLRDGRLFCLGRLELSQVVPDGGDLDLGTQRKAKAERRRHKGEGRNQKSEMRMRQYDTLLLCTCRYHVSVDGFDYYSCIGRCGTSGHSKAILE